jgi:hypothetical protein
MRVSKSLNLEATLKCSLWSVGVDAEVLLLSISAVLEFKFG